MSAADTERGAVKLMLLLRLRFHLAGVTFSTMWRHSIVQLTFLTMGCPCGDGLGVPFPSELNRRAENLANVQCASQSAAIGEVIKAQTACITAQ